MTSVTKKKPSLLLKAKPKPQKTLLKQKATRKSAGKKLPPAISKKPLAVDYALAALKQAYPDAHCELNHNNAFELLAATILSAQCTDVRVNLVTPELFRRFPNAHQMAKASLPDLEELVRTTGFFKNKAKSLKGMATILVQKHGGEVPQNLDDLVELPGVGRKTANVVLGNAFGITSGVVVDTHVTRLSQRFGWSTGGSAEKIEQRLCKLVPKQDWILVSHLLIFHGRRHCKAPTPRCETCFLFDACPRRRVK